MCWLVMNMPFEGQSLTVGCWLTHLPPGVCSLKRNQTYYARYLKDKNCVLSDGVAF